MPMQISAKGKRFLDMTSLARQFAAAVPNAERVAADEATKASRATFQRLVGHRPIAPVRAGRPTTEGQFASDILWEVLANQGGLGGNTIGLDIGRMPPYVFIQEIGTGQSAGIGSAGRGIVGQVHVRSQVGRLISANLYFGSGPGGNASRAHTGASDEQLYYASELNAQSLASAGRRRKRIRREIKGKHFIADGAIAGYVQLDQMLTDEAKRIFR